MDQVTVPRELLRQVLDATTNLGLLFERTREWVCLPMELVAARAAEKALRNALEQPAVEPVAWRWAYKGQPDSDKCFPMPVPDQDVQDVAKMRAFPRTVQLLYAAPQAQQEKS